MTRINLIEPKELTDQHLIAEYRELPRIFWAVRSKLLKNQEIKIWEKYKMWTGHVIFFYNKLWFLEKRYYKIVKECQKRWFTIKYSTLDLSDIPNKYKNDYKPNTQDFEISISRIEEKLNQKNDFIKKIEKSLIN